MNAHWLGHPALGDQRRWTVRAVAALLGLAVLVGSESLLSRSIPTDGAPPQLVWPLDLLAALAVLGVALAAVIGIGYALVNGGPVLAAAFPFVPLAVAVVVGRPVHPTADAAILSAGAAAAAGVGTVQARAAADPQLGPRPVGLGATVAFGIVGAWTVVGLVRAGGPHLRGGLVVASLLLALAALCLVWTAIGLKRDRS